MDGQGGFNVKFAKLNKGGTLTITVLTTLSSNSKNDNKSCSSETTTTTTKNNSNFEHTCTLDGAGLSPLSSWSRFSMIVRTRSMPMETPTQGVCPEAENMPTKLSYRPPAAIDPTYRIMHHVGVS